MEEYEGKKIVVLKDNEEIECKVLFTISNSNNGKDYIIYSDDSVDKDGNLNVFASAYSKDHRELLQVDKKDRDMIEMVVDVVREELLNA